ncbi:MAG: VWA domain-containing protein [Terriglobia bacterium]
MNFPSRAIGRNHIRRWLPVVFAALLGGLWLTAQQAPPPGLPATVLRVTTRLVLVDVVVTDKKGQPVTDLTREDFTLLEDGKSQRIATFSLEQPLRGAQERPAPPPLPPHVYTNRPEHRMPPGPLTILLLDALNTPLRDQPYVREQMLRYLDTQLKPNQRTAALALVNGLLVLQDFTADPALLRTALENYRSQKSAQLSQEKEGPILEIPPEIAALAPQVVANIERFEMEVATAARDARVQLTLGALRAIARAVAGYPGRKNLVWVSGAFPFTIVPEQSDDYDLFRSYARQMRRTANILADAQVAVYPVDARGLVGYTMADASESGRNRFGLARAGAEFGEELTRRNLELVSTHQTMNQVAADTGGRAYYNRNDIDAAVALSVADGSTYYTLGFYPEKKDWDGEFRRLQVKLARKGLRIRHRRGYYALDPTEQQMEDAQGKEQELLAALSNPLPATVITFLARIRPPQPAAHAQVQVEFLVDAHTLAFEEIRESRRRCDVDFLVAAFSPEGKVVASSSRTLGAALPPETYARFRRNGLPFRMPLELEPGRYQLRLVVRDNRTGLLGATTVPLVLETPENPSSH